jgi:hypothetical protein
MIKTARFCNVESYAVFNQKVILKSQILHMLQRFLHFRSSNGIYNAVSGWCQNIKPNDMVTVC